MWSPNRPMESRDHSLMFRRLGLLPWMVRSWGQTVYTYQWELEGKKVRQMTEAAGSEHARFQKEAHVHYK